MKRVNFKTLSIRNFFSIGNDPVFIEFKPGITIITGQNLDKNDRKNGVGKTTICNAFYFAIFGKTLDSELKKDLIVNNITNKSAEVTITFEVDDGEVNNYRISRTINPSRCSLYKNGNDITLDSIKSTDEFILNLLNASPEIFQNCVIMTANNAIPFMAKSKVEKRKFIEGIFNLEVFSKMLSEVREEFNEHKKAHDVEYAKLQQLNGIEENILEKISNARQEKERKFKEINEKIEKYQRDAEKLQQILQIDYESEKKSVESSLNFTKDSLSRIESEIESLTSQRSQAESVLIAGKTQLSKVNLNVGTCESCLRPIKLHDRQEIEREIQKIKENLKGHAQNYVKLGEKIEQLREERTKTSKKLHDLCDDLRRIEGEIRNKTYIEERLRDILGNIESLKQERDNIKEDELSSLLAEPQNKKKIIQDKVNGEQKQLALLDVAKFVLSEEGVKSYIVRKILDLFNGILLRYIKRLDGNCIVYFNEFFEEEILNEKGKNCSYYNFSGAERKAIDLACWFAFKDIRRVQGNVTYNVSFYDELFDSSIDEKGLSYVTEILNSHIKEYQECVMVISHRKEHSVLTDNIIFLEKSKGITRRVDIQ